MRSAFFPPHTGAGYTRRMMPDWLIWPALWLLALAISRLTDIDMMLAERYFDPATQGFPLRSDWLWSDLLHDGIKHADTFAWTLLLGATLHARRHDLARYQPLVFTLVGSALALFVNGLLKNQSAHSCPWHLSTFGGEAGYFRLLAAPPANPGPGHCLPSGHAAVGFMWWPAVYACARWQPRWRWPAALLVSVFGAFCGYVQMARGAHFLSHILIAAAVCGGVTSLLYHLPTLKTALQRPQP